MRFSRTLGLLTLVMGLSFAGTSKSQAQVSINIGAAPVCPYGYYDYAPYPCAPSGYYGPEWFTGGAFVGAGPWFHGPANFHGNVDNHFDVHNGYHGPMPQRGEHPAPHPQAAFHGNESRDGRGHVSGGEHK
jgi:hypothetical protein